MSKRPKAKSRRRRAQRTALFHEQNGRCFYCHDLMILEDGVPGEHNNPRLCTLEHLYPKGHPLRRSNTAHAAACHECNAKRGREWSKKLTREQKLLSQVVLEVDGPGN